MNTYDSAASEAEILEEKIITENIEPALKLDYKLKDADARAALVSKIVAATPQHQLTNRYLEILGDYMMGALTKEERRSKLYLTDNRQITINRRETSFEGLAAKFENGEDGIYNLIVNDKNIIFAQKDPITEKDIEEVPGLKRLREDIAQIEEAYKAASGRSKYLLKKQLIEMQRDQYVLRNAFRQPIYVTPTVGGANKIDLSEKRYIDEKGEPQSTGLISFFNPAHISALLTYYTALEVETNGHFQDDFYYLLQDFKKLLSTALKGEPLYYDLVQLKLENKTNIEIQKVLQEKYGILHTVEYLSALYRNKIPKMIAAAAEDEFLVWHYTHVEPGEWKVCSHCGQKKLKHNHFFSKNNTSKDGYYSWCKACRRQMYEEKKKKKG